MKPGPKAKPKNYCNCCNKFASLTREYCHTCYVKKIRSGELEKLEFKKLPNNLSDIQKNYLIGSLLGDGCLFKHKPTHLPYFCVQRQKKDIQYSKWELELLGDFVCKWCEGSSYDKRTNKTYDWVKLRTHRCVNFSSFYEKWYPNGKKNVPLDIVLNPLTLAVWFADDGYIREVGSGKLQLKLSTHGFDISSVEILTKILSTRYNEYFGITLEKGITPVIYASSAASWAFCKEIDKVLPPIDRKRIWTNIVEQQSDKPLNYFRKTKNGTRIKD